MSDQYNIKIQRPLRTRRGDSKLMVVARDAQGIEIYRDRADLNLERERTKIAQRVADLTGDDKDLIANRLLDKLSQLPLPAPPSTTGAGPAGQTALTPTKPRPGA